MEISKAITESVMHICDVMDAKLSAGEPNDALIYGSFIPIYDNTSGGKKEIQFYLYFHKEVLKDAAGKLLLARYTEDDLDDLSRELANQIIGYAKNLLNDTTADHPYKLGTPEFLGAVPHFGFAFEWDQIYNINGNTLKIGYKRV